MEGKEYTNKFGEVGVIINYVNSHNVQIKSTNGYIKTTELKHLKDGSWKTPYSKSVFGVGYIGVGDYKVTINNDQMTPEYRLWSGLIQRVYNPMFRERSPWYEDCTVCEEWHCFQNFAKWYNENKWDCNGEQLAVDKDILIKGNRCYCPENCLLVPTGINSLFIKKSSSRGDLPIGVSRKNKRNDKFVGSLMATIIREDKFYKTYNTVEEAFQGYKEAKEQYIKDVADLYKSKYPEFPQKLYDAMYSYKVEITD